MPNTVVEKGQMHKFTIDNPNKISVSRHIDTQIVKFVYPYTNIFLTLDLLF